MKECEVWNKKGSGFEFQLLRLWAVANHVTPLILLPPSTRGGGTSLQGPPCPRSLDLSPTPAPGGRDLRFPAVPSPRPAQSPLTTAPPRTGGIWCPRNGKIFTLPQSAAALRLRGPCGGSWGRGGPRAPRSPPRVLRPLWVCSVRTPAPRRAAGTCRAGPGPPRPEAAEPNKLPRAQNSHVNAPAGGLNPLIKGKHLCHFFGLKNVGVKESIPLSLYKRYAED